MRSFLIVERIGDLAIAEYLDNKKKTFVNMKTGKVAFKEFKKIKLNCEFPFSEDDAALHSEYYDLSTFDLADEDGFYSTTTSGEFIFDDKLFEEVYCNMVRNGSAAAIEDIDFKCFEPGCTKFHTIKAAISAYLDATARVLKKVEEADDKVCEYVTAVEYAEICDVITKKQYEYKTYVYDMVGDEVEVEDPEEPYTVNLNIIDMAFDEDLARLKNEESQM